MAPPQPKAAAKPAAAPAGGVSKAKVGKSRNYDLGNGVVRFSKSKMFHKKVSQLFELYYIRLSKICRPIFISMTMLSLLGRVVDMQPHVRCSL